MCRIWDLQQLLEGILIISHHRDEHGRLVVLIHGPRQGWLCCYQLECELAVSAADSVVQRVAFTFVLVQDRRAQLLITAKPEQKRS
jgi:hypothetical protein